MLSKNEIKAIQLLHTKKGRAAEAKFLVEGAKNVLELLNSDFAIEKLYLSEPFYKENELSFESQKNKLAILSIDLLEKIGTLQSNNAAVAVVGTKANNELLAANDWVLVLDQLQDPGNLGTIIRIADWYGITKIVCSENTVECYNPKTIMATMGSFTRVKLFYTDLNSYLQKCDPDQVWLTAMNGTSVYTTAFKKAGYLLIGNEANGISEAILNSFQNKITIPKRGGAESLNAGIATAIVLDNIFRA
jgi:RNA methyltransferase, TrmH family